MTLPPLLSSPEEVLPLLPVGGGRLMAFDVGTKTIGLALGDTLTFTAVPLHTFQREKLSKDLPLLLKQVQEWAPTVIVVGLPLNMDGSEGPRCQSVRDFVKAVLPALKTPMVLWDERLSSFAVERTLISLDVSRAKRKNVIDAHAACFILQGFLQRLNYNV